MAVVPTGAAAAAVNFVVIRFFICVWHITTFAKCFDAAGFNILLNLIR